MGENVGIDVGMGVPTIKEGSIRWNVVKVTDATSTDMTYHWKWGKELDNSLELV